MNDARLARLPPQQRAALIDQKREIDVAEANLEAARVALRDAEAWRGIVHRERAATDERLDAARDELDLARRTAAGSGQVGAAEWKLTIAQRRQGAALAKLDYADRLVRLRHDEVALRQAQLDSVRARSELAEVDELHDVGRGADLGRNQFVSARDDAQTRVISRQREVDTGRGAVEAARVRWEQMYRSYDTAMRSVGHATPGAPPAPQALE